MFGVDGLVSTFCTGWQSQGQAGEGGGVSHVLSIQDGHGWGCVRLRWLRVQCTGVQWSRTADSNAILFWSAWQLFRVTVINLFQI